MEPNFVCSKCESEFPRVDVLHSHIVLEHYYSPDITYKCLSSTCTARFVTEFGMLKHMSKGHKPLNPDAPVEHGFHSLKMDIYLCLHQSINMSFAKCSEQIPSTNQPLDKSLNTAVTSNNSDLTANSPESNGTNNSFDPSNGHTEKYTPVVELDANTSNNQAGPSTELVIKDEPSWLEEMANELEMPSPSVQSTMPPLILMKSRQSDAYVVKTMDKGLIQPQTSSNEPIVKDELDECFITPNTSEKGKANAAGSSTFPSSHPRSKKLKIPSADNIPDSVVWLNMGPDHHQNISSVNPGPLLSDYSFGVDHSKDPTETATTSKTPTPTSPKSKKLKKQNFSDTNDKGKSSSVPRMSRRILNKTGRFSKDESTAHPSIPINSRQPDVSVVKTMDKELIQPQRSSNVTDVKDELDECFMSPNTSAWDSANFADPFAGEKRKSAQPTSSKTLVPESNERMVSSTGQILICPKMDVPKETRGRKKKYIKEKPTQRQIPRPYHRNRSIIAGQICSDISKGIDVLVVKTRNEELMQSQVSSSVPIIKEEHPRLSNIREASVDNISHSMVPDSMTRRTEPIVATHQEYIRSFLNDHSYGVHGKGNGVEQSEDPFEMAENDELDEENEASGTTITTFEAMKRTQTMDSDDGLRNILPAEDRGDWKTEIRGKRKYRKNLTTSEKEAIVRMKKKGYKAEEIAKMFDCNKQTVCRVVNKHTVCAEERTKCIN
ncbi:hypothetical protein Ddc_13752 [Ditylenchus destructor]|nr:hypothetical protein Ddc_13752 [Ditylenchus destructor]